MKSRDFCYWLQGFFEISRKDTLDKEQVAVIQKHLGLVFKHEIDPSFGDQLEDLRNLHNPGEQPIMC